MGEFMMMGLRLTREGVSRRRFHARFGRDLMEEYGPEIVKLVRSDLLEWAESAGAPGGVGQRGAGDVVRLTKRGRLLGNRVFSEFVESASAT
jgi:oxygen-independent coproporphyrinogen-3 oxidase